MDAIDEIKEIFRNSDCITLDVDSAICRDETIDELAIYCGKEEEILPITTLAMEGHLNFQQALKKRMQILQLTSETLEKFIIKKKIDYTPNAENFIKLLQKKCFSVYLLTGGFHEIVDNVAKNLNIPLENVFANRIIFDDHGHYLNIDENELASKDNGKADIIKLLKNRHNYKNVVHIGDGMNDAKVCPPADIFIGYGGVHVRDKIKNLAHWYITDFQELINELQK